MSFPTLEESAEVWRSLVRSEVSDFEEKIIKNKEQRQQKREEGEDSSLKLRSASMSQLQQIFQGKDWTH